MSFSIRLLALAAGMLLVAVPAEAATRALLIGVSNYPAASVGNLQLTGPKFDVAIMAKALGGLGVAGADMRVLADGMAETDFGREADGQPTKAAILREFEALKAGAKPDDTIVIYMSGHGSRSPEKDPEKKAVPEDDGLDEIFLPIDIGVWNDGIGQVENALIDDEIGAAVNGIRAKGAFVWLVVDACHSGTLTRNAGTGETQEKKVDPAVLGVPKEKLEAAARRAAQLAATATRSGTPAVKRPSALEGLTPSKPAGATRSGAGPEGGYVAYYAAYSDQVALQENMPRGIGVKPKTPHGILTYYLTQALRSGRAANYRDLAFQVLAGYEQWGARAPVPLFEGDLTTPVFGLADGGPRGFPVRRGEGGLRLAAGLLDDVSTGSVIAVARADKPDAVLAYARVTAVTVEEATLEPVEFNGVPVPKPSSLASGGLVGTVAEKAVRLDFSVARPAAGGDPASALIRGALDAMAASRPVPVEIVESGGEADIALIVQANRLWFVNGGDGLVTEGREKTPSLPLDKVATPADAEKLMISALRSVGKSRNLLRVVRELSSGEGAKSLKVEALLYRPEAPPPAPGAKAPDDRACGEMDRDRVPASATPLNGAAGGIEVPELAHCDIVYFSLSNGGANPIDVTPLYVDGEGAIAYMGPAEGIRLEPNGAGRVVPIRIVTWSTKRGVPLAVGLERLVLLSVVRPTRDAVPADFRYLAQASLAQTATRGGGGGALRQLLEGTAFATGATRSANVGGGLDGAGAVEFRWRVVAPK